MKGPADPPERPERSIPFETALQLPFDFYRTPTTKSRPEKHSFTLTIPAAAEPDALLAAAFGVLLFRYNSQPSIALDASRVESSGAVRRRPPLELALGNDATGRSVLEQAGALLRRIDAPPPDRDPQTPANGGAAITLLAPGLARGLRDGLEAMGAGRDLELVAPDAAGRIDAAFVYDSSVFKRSSVERFAGHLQTLLAHMAAEPDAPVSTLRLLPPEERRWIESVCDGSARPSSAELVHRSFERRAALAPEATAVRYRDLRLTYGELNSRANRLARRLAADGLGAEARVAAFLEPSLDVAVVLLAILKAGAVYVPLDPSYPAARIRDSLEEIEPRLVVTRAQLREMLPEGGVPVLLLDDLDRPTAGLPDSNLDLAVRADQTAYVYYTSGTTGKPKGAAASQANLASYIHVARERYGIGASDVMPAIARFTFSISMFELMSPLAAGGTLIVLDREHILDLTRLAKTLEETTIFHMGPSLLKRLLAHIARHYPDVAAFARVRHASSGGDMVSPETLEGLKRTFANAEVFVIYGCSEISCMGTTYPVSRERPVERTCVGRPFENMAVRVLDSAFNLLPAGVAGEIFFAGDGLVKGYLNRPDLTAERFFQLDGRRFYRTGDMGRLSDDGWLEILGRSDFQVKLRGMRVELGEVEHNLRRAPGVRDGVVAAKTIAGDEKSLVAYVVLDRAAFAAGRGEPAIAAVRRYMAENLPDYMVPATYVELDNLPLSPNMKVDRRALPDPDELSRRAAAGAELREPATETEKRLAGLWKKHLRLDRIGRDDHFFDLGGHSVLGLTLILDVERELGVALTGLEVLRESLAGQAAICDRRLGVSADSSAAPARTSPARAAAGDAFESFFFGDGQALHGVLSGTRGSEAVLICPSVGQEHVRAHFVLQRLAKKLASRGVPSLRFDYYGCGDSLGESAAATCGRWRRDIREAHQELRRRTGAGRIIAVGVRLGATLLAMAAADGLDLAGLVLWDPVSNGSSYLAELSETHERFLPGWRRLLRRPPARADGASELIGLVLSAANRRELEALLLEPSLARPRRPVKWLATSRVEAQERFFRTAAGGLTDWRLETLGFDPGWSDTERLGVLIPDVGVSTALAGLAAEAAR
jgi:amino acid adenylation domain-containing protein